MKKLITYLLIFTCSACLWGCKGAGTFEEVEAQGGEYTDSQEETIYYPSEEDAPAEEAEKKPEKKPQPQAEKKPAAEKPAQTQKPAESKPSPAPSEAAPDYQSISCRGNTSIDWKEERFQNAATGLCLQLPIPSDWEVIKKNDHTYHFQRNGKVIAILSSIAFPDPKDSFENNSLTEVERLMVFYDIYWYQVDKKDTFYRHFEFNAKYFEDEFNFYLRVNYAELDTGATNYMARNALPITKGDSIRPYSESNGSKAILFLEGVDASLATVSTHLNDMFQQSKKGLFADAAFLPNGSVEDFPSMKHYQKAIRQGQYSHVFVNGFYETDDCSTALGLLKECCAASNTELVLFPSYSESWDIIDEAREFHSDIPLLDWKAEMHRLITSGISVSDLCYPSFRNTTNEVGGYSGAHLVYRTLFRERPPMVSENSSFYQAIKRIYPAEYFNKDGSESLFGGKIYPIQ